MVYQAKLQCPYRKFYEGEVLLFLLDADIFLLFAEVFLLLYTD